MLSRLLTGALGVGALLLPIAACTLTVDTDELRSGNGEGTNATGGTGAATSTGGAGGVLAGAGGSSSGAGATASGGASGSNAGGAGAQSGTAGTAGSPGGSGGGTGLGLGEPCLDGGECASGFCADNVCCDASCSGTCEACVATLTGGVADGTCAHVIAGTDPEDECPDQGIASCGTDGSCDGAGACRFYAQGLECEGPSCTAGVKTQPRTCDGAGTCESNGTVNCNPASCDGNVCSGQCSSDASCDSTQYCDLTSGDCEPKRPDGDPCQPNKPGECQSGFCSDGVCCDSACDSPCERCGSDGVCSFAAAGADPDGDCPDDGVASCARDGACDGAGDCRMYADATVCSPASCSASTQTNASQCDSGSCTAQGTTDCSPYLCGSTTCLTSCGGDGDCVGTHYCSGSTCTPKKSNGAGCSGGNECTSTHCIDGVCCNNACTGTCRACTADKRGTGSDGTCGNILSGKDPDDECSAQNVSTCGRNGFCNGSGACDLYANGTVCVAGTCNGTTVTSDRLCDGSGTCGPGLMGDCAPYVCSGASCRTSCTNNSHCSGSNICNNGECLPSGLGLGSPCSSPTQCTSGFCVDDVCCESSCTQQCYRCDGGFPGIPGQCSEIECGPVGQECPFNQRCVFGSCSSQCL